LVTGGAGYIGSHTAKELARAGFEPIVFDNFSQGHRWAVKRGPVVEADLGDIAAISRAVVDYRIEAVIHFAANAYVGESMEHPRKYMRDNIVNTLNLLTALLDSGVKRIIFSSSCTTYGVPESLPIAEHHPQRPVNPYGESKLFIERTLHWYGSAYGLQWMVLRYFNAAGADPEGELGEHHDPETHLIPLVLQTALGQRRELQVYGVDYGTSDGTAVRDYIHVTDLAKAHSRSLEHLLAGGESTALNLGTGHGHSVREVIRCAEKVAAKVIPVRECPRRAGDPPVLVADARKAASVLNWCPLHSDIETIVRTAWDWHRKH